ncbi:hypothetical protein OS493_013561 [Desmophyllum pertusum]|uniref:UspA domain-containing protein n=1 Tax=Desmophyllum pertusum TaxID=174260 RepID=A0A9X0DB25_9CNID|nr:hypothetical protein OS493_013561 [Desmophyllum pertusum]
MDEDISRHRIIVLGVDDSEWSEKAFDFFLKHVYVDGDHVIAVHCVEPLHPPVVPAAMASPEWKEHLDKHAKKIKDVETKYEDKGKENRLHMIIKVVAGSEAGAAICKEATNEHASLVVVGSRGAGVVRRTILGSVSSYVVHHAHVPVLVCPKPHSGHH